MASGGQIMSSIGPQPLPGPGQIGVGGVATLGGTSIGVGGQISTANYKSKLLRVRKEQD